MLFEVGFPFIFTNFASLNFILCIFEFILSIFLHFLMIFIILKFIFA